MDINIKTIRRGLFQLMRMDYAAEIYSDGGGVFRVSYYHLNSTHNAFCTIMADGTGVPSIDHQLTSGNKRADKLIFSVVSACGRCIQIGKKAEMAAEFDHYNAITAAIFKAKYSVSETLYAYNN